MRKHAPGETARRHADYSEAQATSEYEWESGKYRGNGAGAGIHQMDKCKHAEEVSTTSRGCAPGMRRKA